MTSYVEVPTSRVADIARQFGYKKRKVLIWPVLKVTLTQLNWDHGTKNEYHLMSLLNGKAHTMILDRDAPWNNRYEGQKVEVGPNMIIIRTGFFQGRASTMYIYVHPDNMPRLLDGA